MVVEVAAEHPVNQRVTGFRILDETYKGMWISPDVQVLLTTDHPTSDGPVAWIGPYEKARVVYIQLGHGREAHLNPAFRRLVRNAVLWTAGR
jgi:type 1 glutamine amidotransferase